MLTPRASILQVCDPQQRLDRQALGGPLVGRVRQGKCCAQLAGSAVTVWLSLAH